MKFEELSARIDEVKRIYNKIQRKEKLTPEEEKIAEVEFPPDKRCSCCGRILILM